MIIPVGYSEARLNFTGVGLPQGAQVTLGLHNSAGLSPTAIAGHVGDQWYAQLRDDFPTHVTLDTVQVKNGPNADGPDGSVTVAQAGNGSAADVICGAAMLITKYTALGGRKHRGRSYLPVITEDKYGNGGFIDGAFVTDTVNDYNAWLAGITSFDLTPVLLHNEVGLAPDAILTIAGQTLCATQRRRMRR